VSRFRDPETLGSAHDTEHFDCGVASLNLWLTRHADQAGASASASSWSRSTTGPVRSPSGMDSSRPTDPLNLQMLIKDLRAVVD